MTEARPARHDVCARWHPRLVYGLIAFFATTYQQTSIWTTLLSSRQVPQACMISSLNSSKVCTTYCRKHIQVCLVEVRSDNRNWRTALRMLLVIRPTTAVHNIHGCTQSTVHCSCNCFSSIVSCERLRWRTLNG